MGLRAHPADPWRHRCRQSSAWWRGGNDPSLRMRARLAAQATVRVPSGTGGRGTSLLLGLNHPRGLRPPVHRYACRRLRGRQWQDTRGQQHQSFGRSRGGFSTKIHLKTDLDGNPLDFHLTGGEASDSTEFETSLDIGPDIRPRVAITDKILCRRSRQPRCWWNMAAS